MKIKHLVPLAFATLALPITGFAAEKKEKPAAPAAEKTAAAPAAAPAEEKKEMGVKALPYQGKVASVDAAAKTFTTKNKDGKENVFSVTDKTKIEKADGSAATLADLKADDVVRGSRTKISDGKWEAVKLIIGAKEGGAKKGGDKATEDKPADAKPVDKK